MLAWLNLPSPADYFVPSFLICIEDGYRDNPYHSRQVGKRTGAISESAIGALPREDPPECV